MCVHQLGGDGKSLTILFKLMHTAKMTAIWYSLCKMWQAIEWKWMKTEGVKWVRIKPMTRQPKHTLNELNYTNNESTWLLELYGFRTKIVLFGSSATHSKKVITFNIMLSRKSRDNFKSHWHYWEFSHFLRIFFQARTVRYNHLAQTTFV